MSFGRVRLSSASRLAAFDAFLVFVMTVLALERSALACPFCGHGGAGDSALSTVLVVGGAFLVIRALCKRA